jgi:hypothetical protein
VFAEQICTAVEEWSRDFDHDHADKHLRKDLLITIREETFTIGAVTLNSGTLD